MFGLPALTMEPGEMNNLQLAFQTMVYAVILYQSSGLISGGSELLCLVPAVSGIVGSVVLPILGAVPDGMMVLFSGIGENAQETVSVGVGALAGSTVMLLTIPWFICIVFGRVPIKDGKVQYKKKGQEAPFAGSGISFEASIAKGAKIMLLTTLLYFVIQIPASYEEREGKSTAGQGKSENIVALIGMLMCVLCFAGYLAYCFMEATSDKLLTQILHGINEDKIDIVVALDIIREHRTIQNKSKSGPEEALMEPDKAFLKQVLKPFFKKYDIDHSKTLTKDEISRVAKDLGMAGAEVDKMFEESDKNHDNIVSLPEFVDYIYSFMQNPSKMRTAPRKALSKSISYYVQDEDQEEDEDEDEEEEGMPKEWKHLSPDQQLKKLIFRSCYLMGIGTLLVLIFSDPMVDALSEWGKRLNINPFYISFVLAPFASNASELLSAYTYAVKKTEKGMTTSLSTLIGAACMNNTFVLAIFFALIYLQGLAWQFTAETVAMVLIQWVIGGLAISSSVQTTKTAMIILACYPGCLVVVYVLENFVGLD